MVIVNLVLLILIGFFTSVYFLRNATFLIRIGSVIFFMITAVPFLNINLALFLGYYINSSVILFASLIGVLLFLGLFLSKRPTWDNCKDIFCPLPSKWELAALGSLIFLLFFLYRYYSNNEFSLSLASYLIKGDAECFYMQTFRTLDVLNPGIERLDLIKKVYDIICTPGNILFTATFLPLFKLSSFKLLYLIFNSILFIFSYLIIKKLTKSDIIALIVAFFAVLNPYLLSVEVLDRNVMALSISVFLFYVLLEYKEKIFLQGAIFGVLGGAGLRFLPLTFIVPILILWGKEISFKRAALFIIAFFITFTFNIPHIFFNGFNSLGENMSTLQLLYLAFTKWERTPFLPYPSAIFYLMNIVNYFGYLISGIICLGLFSMFKENKKLFFVFFTMFSLVLLVLFYQRNWIEGDKYRIVISAFLALFVFFAFGIKELFRKASYRKRFFPLLISFALPVIFVRVISLYNFVEDTGFYNRKLLYQAESDEYYHLTKDFLSKVRVFPDYSRLFQKLDLKRKRLDDAVTFRSLFPSPDLPGVEKFDKFYSQWGKYFLNTNLSQIVPLPSSPDGYVYLKVNLENLVRNIGRSIEEIKDTDMVSLDLSNNEQLSDIFYSQVSVDWQENKLPVCIMLNNDNLANFKELNIDLNAFASVGKDDIGIDVVNSVNFILNPSLRQYGLKTGLKSFPLYEENKSLIFKVPKDTKIIIKNWFINGENGTPFKVDSWLIRRSGRGNYKIKFFYNEPESYL